MSLLTLALAAALAGADEPTYAVVVELDNVCGRDCVALLEKELRKIDGVKSAEMYGDKFHFRLEVLETKSLLPAAVLAVTDRIRKDSKGEEDFPLLSFEVTVAGHVEKQGDAQVFTAKGSGQKFALKSARPLQEKSTLTLTGRVSAEKGLPLPLLEVVETPK
ncbi:MAG TPA: hypothetical protein VE981_23585 [Planctomycetota bacterium]|nr:hypothetical protein [Planctomycetota bacterium]